MGSYYDLRIGGYSVLSTKWPIDHEVLSIFVESDRVIASRAPDLPCLAANVHGEDQFFGYCASITAIIDRLDVMGFTASATQEDFRTALKGAIEDELEIAESWEVSATGDKASEDCSSAAPSSPTLTASNDEYLQLAQTASEEARFLSHLTSDKWISAIRRLKTEAIRWPEFEPEHSSNYRRPLDTLEDYILGAGFNNEHPHLGFHCSDARFLIRAFLMCADLADSVVLDCTDMIEAGYFDLGDGIAAQAREAIAANARKVEKLLVLTEGRSDTRLLKATLDVLYPHLREFVSFLDHESFAVSGGAGNLLMLVRGLAGAGVSNRVLALFDNDTAGSVQFRKAQEVALPPNFRVRQLPYLPFAENYPTLGPTGPATTNINGSACSIELYLGDAALKESSGQFVPVQWTGIDRSLSRYQGELLDKEGVQQRYLQCLQRSNADLANMELVFQHILSAFHA